ncbi:phospho-sugar mutase [Vagococcus sp. PNs007]|uniref:Phosphoglucomutase n=1 Tax=Vagococcus proximus TaxID=2991417 RepID=A0ABT5X0I0_9ENTE|nr:phospho-sugar mutase [Vagococcus proximus]MDF0479513.1 phospho-sugar mutase [Vagococcus proximus]
MSWKENYQEWIKCETLEKRVRDDLEKNKENLKALEEAFYAPLEFGTAGMRGILGAGINRMNIYTVRQATEGLALFVDSLGEEAKKQGVAIAFDSRHQSPEFGLEAARVLANHGIKAYLFESLRPTPELSFAVRDLNCVAGIMITASHNPAEYNGYKVYGADGGQMPPKEAAALTTLVRSVEKPLEIEVASHSEATPSPFITVIGEEMDMRYLEKLKSITMNQTLVEEFGKNLKLVFTPLHGTGKMIGERALKQAGFEKFVVEPEQGVVDPDFSTVASPNPEEYAAFEYAIRLGKKEEADLLVATDPDADRLGAAVRLPDGSYQILTGNQIGAILIHYILTTKKEQGQLPTNGAVVKSIVSSDFSAEICRDFDVEMMNVLTGFKFIAEKIETFEKTNSHEFLFGFEESYGYLVKSFVRDKDAIQALVLLSEVAAYYKSQNKTLFDGLQDLFKTYGYFDEKTISVTMPGIEGTQKIKELMAKSRTERFESFGGMKVVSTEDFLSQKRISFKGDVSGIDLPQADVLKYTLEDGSWVAIRPSGTEPKIKFYIGAKSDSSAEVAEKINKIEETIQELIK